MYQDMLVKPQEIISYRTPDLGGLGLYDVKSKCLAMLIHNFLLQAVCPSYPVDYYHNTLFRWHVLGERIVQDPDQYQGALLLTLNIFSQ